MLFASGLILERDPIELSELPRAFALWLRDGGSIVAVALGIWALAYGIRRLSGNAPPAQPWTPRSLVFTAFASLSGLLYVVFLGALLTQGMPPVRPLPKGANPAQLLEATYYPFQNLVLTLAGAFALAAVLVPIVADLFTRIRWRRIWALARLSLKEAWSKGVLWVALIIPLIYLYSDWYLTPALDKDQLAQRVKVVYYALTLLIVVTAALLGSFNIPTDVRNQTIHTIVTKPVERYEIVLGRFIGYSLLLLAELMVLTGLSLFYAVRGLHPDAVEESYRARVPLLASKLEFYKGNLVTRGENVGREWDYRRYFGNLEAHTSDKTQYARWSFAQLPSSLGETDRKEIRVEYSFDIFRTTKGDERVQGVKCTFIFAPGGLEVPDIEAKVRELDREHVQQQVKIPDLIEKYGVYVAREVKVADYHTLPLKVPAVLFRKLYRDQGKNDGKGTGEPKPAMQILVSLDRSSGPQMVGVARRDLYVLADEQPFWINFFKGSIGLWFVAVLVLGIALTCSTYLSGVISLLATAFLCGGGLFRDYIMGVAFGTSAGGGPFESLYRMTNKQGVVVQLDQNNPTVDVFRTLDVGYRWFLRRVFSLIPDITRFDLTAYVSSGFDVSWGQVLFADTLVPLLGYLVPCGILAYYLMNSREIANPT
jgi:hypothetical protein